MTEKLTVIYNDTCPICAREVRGYKSITRRQRLPISYRGISGGDLDEFGLSCRDAARRFHVVKDGEIYDGVDAFALVWEEMPKFRWLARLVRLPVVHGLAALLYDHVAAPALFAMHRRRVKAGRAYHRG